MKIGFDCDGVLYNLEKTFELCVPPHRIGPPPTKWNFYHTWDNMTTEEFGNYIAEGVRNRIMFWTGDPYEEAVAAVNSVKKAGHEVYIITHRGTFGVGEKLALEATAFWLESHGFLFDDIILTGDKTSFKTDAMIDDKIENVLALHGAGTEAWVRSQPWNSELEWGRRAPSLNDFTDNILARTLSVN